MKKTACLMLVGTVFFNIGTGALAESAIKVELSSTQYHISGTYDKAEFNRTAFFSVKDSDGGIVHFDGIKTNEDGEFDYYFTMPKTAPTGKYTFFMSGYDSEEPLILSMGEGDEITYINPYDIETALAAVDSESQNGGGNLKAVIEENKKKLRIVYNKFAPYYEKLPEENKSLLANEVKKGAPYGNDIDKFDGVFYKALAIQALRASEKSNIETTLKDFEDYYTIDNENTYPLYQRLAAHKDLVLERFVGMLTGYDDFDKSFNEACILIGIYKANSWGEAAEIFKEYKSNIPFEIAEENIGTAAKAVVGNNYGDMAALKTAVENALKKTTSGTGSSGGGGGRDSSSKGSKDTGGAVFPVSTEIHNDLSNVKQPLYDDINEAVWAKDAIEYLSEKNIMSGYDGKVYPNKEITREEFVRMVLDAFGLFEENKSVEFSDVDKGEWSYKYIACAAEKGIVHGISDDKFGKGLEISRQDMAVIILRTMQLASGEELNAQKDMDFTDTSDIAEYAKNSVAYMTEHGILNGFEDGSFRPTQSATRAQAARMLYAILNENREENK